MFLKGITMHSKLKYSVYFVIPLLLLFLFFQLINGKDKNVNQSSKKPVFGYEIVYTYPHLKTSFTEGLIVDHDTLYESTGRYGFSRLLKSHLRTGEIRQKFVMPRNYFGEGIALYNNKIIQLTYKSHIGFVYDKNTFKLQKTFHYKTEGWGLTTDGDHLIMSDGTSFLYFFDPVAFKLIKRIQILDGQKPVRKLNALTCANGRLYANIWKTDLIAIISMKTGQVIGYIDLSAINPTEDKTHHVLNGIAYRERTNTFLVTGKCWSKLYEIKIRD